MTSDYHLTVKKFLDQNRIHCSLPDYIQRGWNRIYTETEKQLNKRSCIIGPDVQIPNSVVRHRLNTKNRMMKEILKKLQRAFDLPDELLMNLSTKYTFAHKTEEETSSYNFEDEYDDNNAIKYGKQSYNMIINKQREKRRKNEDYKYNYDFIEPMSLDEIIEEIHINIGKDLKSDELKLISQLMQTINKYKKDQVMNIYDELINMKLIDRFANVSKLVQTLEEIQKAFEQIVMKTNVASIETVIGSLTEKDDTYRIAIELLKSYNENKKTLKQQNNSILIDKSSDITDYDYHVYNILIKDCINRLATVDIKQLSHDINYFNNIDSNNVANDHDDQLKYLSEQLNIIFTRSHLDGIKTTLTHIDSPISNQLKTFIEQTEIDFKIKLNEHDYKIIESYIEDYIELLNKNELKLFYERLAQQGTLKRHTDSNQLNQIVIMGLMKKIRTDGLRILIRNIFEAQINISSINKFIETLNHIHDYLQTNPIVSLEQTHNQLAMAYFIEIHRHDEKYVKDLSESVNLYSIAHIPYVDKSTSIEYLKSPIIRICLQRILKKALEDSSINLNNIQKTFYNEQISNLLDEILNGSEEFNSNLLLKQIDEQMKNRKDLPEKIYRNMLKIKLVNIDSKAKLNKKEKKILFINNQINRILTDEQNRTQKIQLIELFRKLNLHVHERVKNWYEKGSNSKALLTKTDKGQLKKNFHGSNKSNKKMIRSLSPNVKRKISSSKPEMKVNMKFDRKDNRTDNDTLPQEIVDTSNIHNFLLDEQNEMIKPEQIMSNEERVDSNVKEELFNMKGSKDTSSEHNRLFMEREVENIQNNRHTIEELTAIENKLSEVKSITKSTSNLSIIPYHLFLSNQTETVMNNILIAKDTQVIEDLSYEKTKAHRILTKTLPSDLNRQSIEQNKIEKNILRINLTTSTPTDADKLSVLQTKSINEPTTSVNSTPKSDSIKFSARNSRRSSNKTSKSTETSYLVGFTKALSNLFSQPEYDNINLQKIHNELISSGHISPLNDFYRSSSDSLRVTLDHCATYFDLIQWTLLLLQTNNKKRLIDFAYDLYSIAVDLDLTLIERIDNAKCSNEVQEHLRKQLQTISDIDLREINSYFNASQLEKLVNISKKLSVASKDRMLSDLNSLILHLIQICYTFEQKYRPMQMRIREIGETYKSRAVIDFARKIDEIEKHLAKTFSITLIGFSQRLNEARFLLAKLDSR